MKNVATEDDGVYALLSDMYEFCAIRVEEISRLAVSVEITSGERQHLIYGLRLDELGTIVEALARVRNRRAVYLEETAAAVTATAETGPHEDKAP